MNYFKESEFKCHCGCGAGHNKMDKGLIDKLNMARELAGVPFVLSSAYRCPGHNKKIGGVANSAHTLGLAVDITCTNGANRYKIIKALIEAGIQRIEAAPTWIHADVDNSKPTPSIFYAPGGKY